MHYLKRIHFELKGNTIEINDLDSKKVATMKIDNSNNSFNKLMIIDGITIYSTTISTAENNGSEKNFERLILYYIENGKVASKTMDSRQEEQTETEKYHNGMDLFYKIFYTINYEMKSTQEIFTDLGENIGTEEWMKKLENNNILTGIRYDSYGKPHEGILITPNKDNP